MGFAALAKKREEIMKKDPKEFKIIEKPKKQEHKKQGVKPKSN